MVHPYQITLQVTRPEPIAKLVGRPLSEREVAGPNPAAAQHRGCKNGNISYLADAHKRGCAGKID